MLGDCLTVGALSRTLLVALAGFVRVGLSSTSIRTLRLRGQHQSGLLCVELGRFESSRCPPQVNSHFHAPCCTAKRIDRSSTDTVPRTHRATDPVEPGAERLTLAQLSKPTMWHHWTRLTRSHTEMCSHPNQHRPSPTPTPTPTDTDSDRSVLHRRCQGPKLGLRHPPTYTG